LLVDQLEIIYYTDPLCCWSWGFEPQWRRLLFEFNEIISLRYCMSGLIPSWDSYNDPMHSVSRPIQMGPVWMHAAQMTGMPMHHNIWMENPPASSYPSCIAVKSMMLQSTAAGIQFLRRLRETVMLEGKNIASLQVIRSLAEGFAKNNFPSLDLQRFQDDMQGEGLEAFRKDVQEVNYRNISRFPTLVMKYSNKQPIMITGYRPYTVLLDAVNHVTGGLIPGKRIDVEEYKKFGGSLTDRELKEILVTEQKLS